MSGRPLDVLEDSLGDPVVVRLKDGRAFYGLLGGYDQHMNVVIDDDPDPDPDLADDVTRLTETTIVRGDNVVTIRP